MLRGDCVFELALSIIEFIQEIKVASVQLKSPESRSLIFLIISVSVVGLKFEISRVGIPINGLVVCG
jgi:hypothetical protein